MSHVEQGDLYTAFVRGVRAGASWAPIDEKMEKHENILIVEAYMDGWSQGRVAVNNLCRDAEKAYGYSASAIRGNKS